MSGNRLAILAVVAVVILAILAAFVLFPQGDRRPPDVASPVSGTEQTDSAPAGDETSKAAAEIPNDDADVELPDAVSTTEVRATDEERTTGEDPELQREAESFVKGLAESSDEPLAVDRLDAFVTGDRPLTGGVEQPASPEAPGPGEPDSPGTQPDGTTQANTGGTVDEAGEGEAAATAGSGDGMADVEDAAPRRAQQSRVDLPLSEEAPVTIAEILGAEEVIPDDAVFYVHTVQPSDDQGIWGIIHDGIIDNFAEGVAMRRGDTSETYQINIPRDADEIRQNDNSSSFLGRLIYDKSQRSWVYNLETDRVGKNPHMIMPGQEIVIVSFSPEELIAIYKHFAQQQKTR